jgi:hypothetical protein
MRRHALLIRVFPKINSSMWQIFTLWMAVGRTLTSVSLQPSLRLQETYKSQAELNRLCRLTTTEGVHMHLKDIYYGIFYLLKKTPWFESASKLYLPSDRRLSAKWSPTFAERGCLVVSVTDPYGRILGF